MRHIYIQHINYYIQNNRQQSEMVRMNVSQMNNRLVELNTFFIEKTEEFGHQISMHEGRLTPKDFIDFDQLVTQIKEQSMRKITNFINQKFNQRCTPYENQITIYNECNNDVQKNLKEFSKYLQEATLQTKEEQHRKQILFQHLSKKFSTNTLLKKSLKAFKDYKQFRQQEKAMNQKMDNIYFKNLKKRAFFPWRTLTYKEGYENTVRRQTQTDIMNIHDQYKSIINILKTKISETDNLISVKKAAKGQFSYALSKNLLKTISNLSLEVMSLNQMSLRDQQFANQSTEKFMVEVDQVIKDKLDRVRQYKREISGQNQEQDGQRKKKITFV